MPPSRLDVIGKVFNNWTILREVECDGYNRRVVVKCNCGRHALRFLNTIRYGKSRYCRRCRFLLRGGVNPGTHHKTGTAEWHVWRAMIERCYNSHNKSYARYGGRGISVARRWRGKNGFSNFLLDMGEKPFPNAQLDRRDNDSNYGPTNCRWVTVKTQARNRRNNRLLTIDKETKTLAERAETSTIKYYTIKDRLQRGWSAKEAVYGPRWSHRSAR